MLVDRGKTKNNKKYLDIFIWDVYNTEGRKKSCSAYFTSNLIKKSRARKGIQEMLEKKEVKKEHPIHWRRVYVTNSKMCPTLTAKNRRA